MNNIRTLKLKQLKEIQPLITCACPTVRCQNTNRGKQQLFISFYKCVYIQFNHKQSTTAHFKRWNDHKEAQTGNSQKNNAYTDRDTQQVFHSYHARCLTSAQFTRRHRSQRQCMRAPDLAHKELACEGKHVLTHTHKHARTQSVRSHTQHERSLSLQ